MSNQIKQITTGQDNSTPNIQLPMRILMMTSLLLHARDKNQVLNLSSLLVIMKVTMMMMGMMMIKCDKNENE
jgi:hypothetical protein